MLTFEYDHFQPTALIELKKETAPLLHPDSPQAKAHRNLADRAGIPFFVVHYSGQLDRFIVRPFNILAKQQIGDKLICEDAKTYVEFLYRLRGRTAPADIAEQAHQLAAEVCSAE